MPRLEWRAEQMARTLYRDTATGRFAKRSTWARSKAQGGDRYKREKIEPGETVTVQINRPREGEYDVIHKTPAPAQTEVVKLGKAKKQKRKGKAKKPSSRDKTRRKRAKGRQRKKAKRRG